ncbi:MAG: hypothetical protein JZD40_02010 [Sulfolobus sp.]|nr:hypothetical protein [Sulfolobus sp.]
MEYKLSKIIDENGNLKSLPKGFSAIELGNTNKLMLINPTKRINIILTRVYKDVYATRILYKDKVYYKFLKYEENLLNVDRKDSYLEKALTEVIRKLEEKFDVEKTKDVLYYLYLIRGCAKGDRSSCYELKDFVEYETVD